MKLLLIPLLVSLSSLCSGGDVSKQGEVVNASNAQVATELRSTSEWCTCSLSVEETIFLQQYDFE